MWGDGSCLVLWKVRDAVALGRRARGDWVRVLSRVPPLRVQPGGRRAVYSPGGAIDVVYTPTAREHSDPVGGSAAVVGPCVHRRSAAAGVRAVCSPGGAIDVVYTPGAREHAGWGNGTARGAGSRVGVVGRVLSSLRVRPDGRIRRAVRPPSARGRRGSGCVFAQWAIDVVYTPGAREHTGLRTIRAGASSLSLPVWWVGLLGPRGGAGQTGRVRAGPGRAGPRARRAGGVVGCGVSGRLVRRRCRSGRCAGGTRGRGRTSRWW